MTEEVVTSSLPPCITVTINRTTEPDLRQMEGTVFAATVAQGPAPTVTKLSVNKGPSTGGTPVTITGSGFAGVSQVKFGSAKATKVTFVSETMVTAMSPPNAAGAVQVTVATPNGTSATKMTFRRAEKFTYKAARKK